MTPNTALSAATSNPAVAMAPAAGRPPAAGRDPAAVHKAAQNFEAVFLSQMLGHMFSGIEVDKTFGGGAGEEQFRSVLIDEYGKALAKRGGIGIAPAIESQLLKMQEARS